MLSIPVFFRYVAGSSFLLGMLLVSASANAKLNQGFFYENLNLKSPQTTVQQFCKSFSQGDFVTCYFILGNDARNELFNVVQFLKVDSIVDPCAMEAVNIFDPESEHGVGSPMFLFAEIMKGAQDTGCLSVDLSGPAEIRSMDPADIGPDTAEVSVEALLPKEEHPVSFTLYRAPSGKWRIQSVRYIDHGGRDLAWPTTER